MTLHSVPDHDQLFTITLGYPAISRPRPGWRANMAPSRCPRCLKPIEVADRIRKVHETWMHDECARTAVAAMGPSETWLMLAKHVAARPSAFSAAQIRTIVQAVVDIAERGFDEPADSVALPGRRKQP